jgi:hypothetical protein
MRECLGVKPLRGMKVNCEIFMHHKPVWIFLIDLSKSVFVGTRKMVNYA